MEELREIREKISLEIMDMNFEELQAYLSKSSKIHDDSVWKNKYKVKNKTLSVAEPRTKYGKK